MQIIKTVKQMQKWSRDRIIRKRSIGFVPTMGGLHDGHLSLVDRSVNDNDVTVVSIFVNPIQFGPGEDLAAYPRPLKKDVRLLRQAGADVVFVPDAKAMYRSAFTTTVEETALSSMLCGLSRPGHFKGVITVVCKLFAVVQPVRAYFGEKDYQQLKIIERMVSNLGFPVKIIPCPVVRAGDGLALSSRNAYLSPGEREKAVQIHASLQKAAEMIQSGSGLSAIYRQIQRDWRRMPGCRLDYLACVDPETLKKSKKVSGSHRMLIAAWLGKTRLIDNLYIKG